MQVCNGILNYFLSRLHPNPGVKRILQEARELGTDPSTDYHAAPLEDDIFVSVCILNDVFTQGYGVGMALHHARPCRNRI